MISEKLAQAARKVGNTFLHLADYFENAAKEAEEKQKKNEAAPKGKEPDRGRKKAARKELLPEQKAPVSEKKEEPKTGAAASASSLREEVLKEPGLESGKFHISSDPRLAEEKKRREEAEKLEQEKKAKKKKKALVLVPLAVILILVASTVPSYVRSREEYAKAAELLEEEDFESARDLFADLGSYSDAQEKVIFDIPYRKALKLLEFAMDNNEEGLELAEIKKTDLPEDESAQVVMYRKAIEWLNALNGYKDSDKKIVVANAGIDEYYEKLNLAAYNQAIAKLEENRYLPARDEFLALGDYRDSSELALECIYRRAKGLLEYAMNNNIREVSIKLSSDQNVQTEISIPRSFLVSQSGDAVALIELKDTCGIRSADIIYEDEPGEGFLPICDAIASEFEFLADYKDSRELEKKAKETGDFTKEFFNLCRSGYLARAQEWLNKYDDAFEERATYSTLINTFLPYCKYWQLSAGDSSLIPYVAGEMDTVCDSFLSAVAIRDDRISLVIAPIEGDYTLELDYLPETNGFRMPSDGTETSIYALINNLGIFTISKYNNMGFALSSCEYLPA